MEGTALVITVEGEDMTGLQVKSKYLTNCCHRFGCSNIYFCARKYFSKLHCLLPPGWCGPERGCHFPFCQMKWPR